MFYPRLKLILLLITASAIIITNAQSLYKYETNIDHMEMAKKDLLIDYGTFRVKKFNRTLYTLDGYLDLLQPFSDELWAQVDIFAEQGNDYHKIMDTRIEKMCTFMKDDTIVVSKVIHSTSLAPAIPQCPLPSGRIHFHNSHMPTERLPFEPVLTKGKIRLKIYLEQVLMADISLYFILTRQTAIY